MKGQGRKKNCLEPGKDCFIYGSLEAEKETGNEGVGLVRCRHLTHKESIAAAFGNLQLNMQTLWLRHLICI